MEKQCLECKQIFSIPERDQEFYRSIAPKCNGEVFDIPTPHHCPKCRHQRRMTFRNERHLYKRKCDATGKEIVSLFSPDKPYKVYDREEWWSDRWSALDYGKDFDFSKPFFHQFDLLLRAVPHFSIYHMGKNVNSDYCNASLDGANCYLCFSMVRSENCLYSNALDECKDCVDCSQIQSSELCYECVNVNRCYDCNFSERLNNCTNCWFSVDLDGCSHCFGCVGLKNKEYYWYNKPISKKEFEERTNFLKSLSWTDLEEQKLLIQEFSLTIPKLFVQKRNADGCTGDNLYNASESFECYNCHDIEHTSYSYRSLSCKNAYDMYAVSGHENINEVMSGRGYNLMYAVSSYDNSDCMYIYNCSNSKNLFGCVGLNRKEYCIFNKQYTKDEYMELVPKIIKHMQYTGEWGQFFPPELSPFGYNETMAHEYVPLEQKEVIKKGWKWHQEATNNTLKENGTSILKGNQIPGNIQDTNTDILKKMLLCAKTGTPYRVVPQEYAFYLKKGLPIPRLSPEERYKQRLLRKNPQKLWERTCMCTQKEHKLHSGNTCSISFETTYNPKGKETVYCEACYRETGN